MSDFWQSQNGQAAVRALKAWAARQLHDVETFDEGEKHAKTSSPSDISGLEAQYLQVEIEIGRTPQCDYLRPLLIHYWVQGMDLEYFRPDRYEDVAGIAKRLGVNPVRLFLVAHSAFARRLAQSIRDTDRKAR